VACELELQVQRKINNIFLVSCLKKGVGENFKSSPHLPPLDEEGHLKLVSEEGLEV